MPFGPSDRKEISDSRGYVDDYQIGIFRFDEIQGLKHMPEGISKLRGPYRQHLRLSFEMLAKERMETGMVLLASPLAAG